MAISKFILNGVTQMDVTGNTNTSSNMLDDVVGTAADGTQVTGNIETKTSANLSANGATVTAPAGYYATSASKSVASGSAVTPATTITANPSISVSSSGLITATASATKSVTPTVSAGYVSSGTAGTITVSGSNTSQLSTQAGTTITPTTSQQTAVAAGKYTTGAVIVDAVPSGTAGTPVATKSGGGTTVWTGGGTTNSSGALSDMALTSTVYSSIPVQTASTEDKVYYTVTINGVSQQIAPIRSNLSYGVQKNFTSTSGWVLHFINDTTFDEYYATLTGYTASTAVSISVATITAGSITVTPSVTNTAGYISGGTITGTAVTVEASEVVSGTKSITANGTGIDVTEYAAVDVAVPSGTPNLQAKTNINPTTSSQTITYDSGYDGLSSVQINAMPSGTAGTPTATKGTVSNHSISVTPSVANSTGYITGGTKTGTAVTVTASELVSGSKSITSNGTGIDVANYATVDVSVAGGGAGAVTFVDTPDSHGGTIREIVAVDISQDTVTAPHLEYGYTAHDKDGNPIAGSLVPAVATDFIVNLTYNSSTQVWEPDCTFAQIESAFNANKNIVVATPFPNHFVTADGYYDDSQTPNQFIYLVNIVGSDIQSDVYIYSEDGLDIDDSNTAIFPTGTINITSSGTTDVSAYASASVGALTLPNAPTTTSSGTSKATISRSTSTRYLNIPKGYNDTAQYYTIDAVPNGTVTAPSSITGTTATVSTSGTNTLTLTKTVSVTPSVTTAGYVSSGTAGNSNVSLSASVAIQGAQTIYPSTSDQTIASSRYLSGTQTIKGVAVSNTLVAENIKSGVTITIGDSADADRITSVTGTYSGGGSASVGTKTATLSTADASISFTSLSGTPKYWFLRTTTQISSSGSTTYYYIVDARYNGTNTTGNSFRIGSTRRIYNVTSGLSYTYSNGTLTVSSNSGSGASPGYFYNGEYELVYIY